jgi:hypothetical protein
MASETLITAWKRQSQWSETANILKRDYENWRLVVLILAVLAAALGALSSQVATQALSALAAIAAALSPVIASLKLGTHNLQAWVRARSASEALKSEIYKYLTITNTQKEKLLSTAQQKILESVADIRALEQPADIPRQAILSDLSPAEYLDKRVNRQIDGYYLPKAHEHAATAKKYKLAHFVLMLIGAALGASNTVLEIPELGPWIAVISTIGASVLAHLAAGRQEYLALAYRSTADRLQDLRDSWLDQQGETEPLPDAITKLVEDCEEAISVQNQDWHAKLVSPSH